MLQVLVCPIYLKHVFFINILLCQSARFTTFSISCAPYHHKSQRSRTFLTILSWGTSMVSTLPASIDIFLCDDWWALMLFYGSVSASHSVCLDSVAENYIECFHLWTSIAPPLSLIRSCFFFFIQSLSNCFSLIRSLRLLLSLTHSYVGSLSPPPFAV